MKRLWGLTYRIVLCLILALVPSVVGCKKSGPEPEPNGPRQLWIMKTNVGAPPKPLGVTFGPHPDNPDVAQLTYGDAPQPFKEPTRIEECADWVLGQLMSAGEPIKPAEVVQMGEKEGYYKMLIYRARQHLGDLVVDTHNRKHPQNAWALPEWGDDDNTVTE